MKSNNQNYYDDFSVRYDQQRFRGYHALIDNLEMKVVAPLAQGNDVLELGCGTGLILRRLSKSARTAVGVDISMGMASKARDRGLNVALASVERLPFADESFDTVCSFKVLAHVSDLTSALQEAIRVTRTYGHLVLELYNPLSLRYVAKRFAGPRSISKAKTEADVFTRWDYPWVARTFFPPSVEIVDIQGVRILTPAAFVHDLWGASKAMAFAEELAMRSPLKWFGGFLVFVLRKTAK